MSIPSRWDWCSSDLCLPLLLPCLPTIWDRGLPARWHLWGVKLVKIISCWCLCTRYGSAFFDPSLRYMEVPLALLDSSCYVFSRCSSAVGFKATISCLYFCASLSVGIGDLCHSFGICQALFHPLSAQLAIQWLGQLAHHTCNQMCTSAPFVPALAPMQP